MKPSYKFETGLSVVIGLFGFYLMLHSLIIMSNDFNEYMDTANHVIFFIGIAIVAVGFWLTERFEKLKK